MRLFDLIHLELELKIQYVTFVPDNQEVCTARQMV